MTDWRKILLEYIKTVVEAEGVSFIGRGISGISDDENKELLDAEQQALTEMHDEKP